MARVNPLSDFYCVEFYTIASLAAKSETGPPHGQPRQLTLALGLQLTGINTQMIANDAGHGMVTVVAFTVHASFSSFFGPIV